MTAFILGLSPKGLFIFAVLGTFIGYFISLAISKSNLPTVAGVMIRVLIVVTMFWDATIEAKTIGDIAFNIEMFVSVLIFLVGVAIGLFGGLKLAEQLSLRR